MMPPMDILWLVAALLGCGVFAGVLAGLLGVGGGIVIVPLLFHVFSVYGIAPDVAMPLSVGTSLSTIVLTSWVSARKHYQRGGVDTALVRRWVLPVLVGVAVGTTVAHYVSGTLLKTLFGVLLVLVSSHMLISARRELSLFENLPGPGVQRGLAVVVGGISALLGIGGGTVMVPLLTMFSFRIHRAVATSSVFGFVISVPATAGYLYGGWHAPGLPPGSTGYINWLAFAALVPATMLCAPLGVRLAYRLNVGQLKRAFAVFLLIVGLKMAFF
ncbi:MAG TPA: sulfite exporter TauE/SafE family protein [Gammaproteobacteria bacterium]|nr:sulfite exporter TauE/SafE family protein [Gammaproteobacteria bacterium]